MYLEQVDEPDREVGDQDLVDLDGRGVEAFVGRKPSWKLNIQGVTIVSDTPTIVVSEAMIKAGFDVAQSWHIFLKVAGQAKREVALTDVVDLRTPGIEKIRLTPKEVNNGEAPPAPRRDFDVLEVDETYLHCTGHKWETGNDGGSRWLVIKKIIHAPFDEACIGRQALVAVLALCVVERRLGGDHQLAVVLAEVVRQVEQRRATEHGLIESCPSTTMSAESQTTRTGIPAASNRTAVKAS